MTTTQGIAITVTALYGMVCLVGGIIGYILADSVASLVTGGIAGVLLLLCAVGVLYQPSFALSAAIVISVALLGRFVPKLIHGWDRLGESRPVILALVMTIGGVLVILGCALALATKEVPPSAP
jgi:uncharacterized membrane protein (UPF0136 family)